MPTPVYIICSESGSDDKTTNQVSFFNVLEKLHFFRNAPNKSEKVLFAFRVTAVWMRDKSDGNTEFEWEFVIELPMSKTVHTSGKGTFSFSDNPETMLWRCTVNYQGPPPVDGSGTLSLEHRVRPKGSTEWLVQKYPLIIEEIDATTAVGQALAPR